VVVDAVARLIPGVLGNEDSSVYESFSGGDAGEEHLLDCPHYTRPAEFRGFRVPDVLLSGHHEVIRQWRRKAAMEKMSRIRPDLMARFREADETRPAPGGTSLERNGPVSHDQPLPAEDLRSE
jgi:tRNA (guanine37-N1)-methyltransferase